MDYMERMRSGIEVRYSDPDNGVFADAVMRANALCDRFNSAGLSNEKRFEVLDELFGRPLDRSCIIKGPFHCDLGINIKMGKNVLINYNCIVLDCAEVVIEDNVLIGPGVQLLTPTHPMDPMARRDKSTIAKPVRICEDVWIGGGAIIMPGVTVGARSVIGAGAVVTKDVPPDSTYVGVPAHPIGERV